MSSSYEFEDVVEGKMKYRWPKKTYFMPPRCVGSPLGSDFLLYEMEKGKLVKKVGVYCHDQEKWIVGIHVTYTDDTDSALKGRKSGSHHEILLKPGETIKRADLWEYIDGHSVRIGRIELKTEDQNFGIGREPTQQNKCSVEVGSGYLAGFTGRKSTILTMLGFIFLKPIEKISMSDVTYDLLPKTDKISDHHLTTAIFANNTSDPPQVTEYDFTRSVTQTNSSSFTSSITKEFPKKLKIEAGLPKILKASGEIGWTKGHTTSQEDTKLYTATLSWSLKGKLNPGESVTCTATCLHGEADIAYKSLVTVTFAGASDQWKIHDAGTHYNSIFDIATAKVSDRKIVEDLTKLLQGGETLRAVAPGGGTSAGALVPEVGGTSAGALVPEVGGSSAEALAAEEGRTKALGNSAEALTSEGGGTSTGALA